MRKTFVYLLILGLTYFISCDRPNHHPSIFQKVERLMPQHPDSALMLLEQIENKENLSRKDKAHYYLLLTEAQDKTFVKHETDSLITIATDYYEETDDLERKAKAWFYKGRINQNLNHPLKAQECFLNALQNEEQIEDHALLGRINNGIGMLIPNKMYMNEPCFISKRRSCISRQYRILSVKSMHFEIWDAFMR